MTARHAEVGRQDGRFAPTVAIVALAAAVAGFFAGREHEHDAERDRRSARELERREVDLAAAARRDRELAVDRALALRLRRRHLDHVDLALRRALDPVESIVDPELVPLLDEWALLRRERRDVAGASGLFARARALDPDADRGRVRDAIAADDVVALRSLATSPAAAAWTAQSLELLGRALAAVEADEAADRLLERATERHPADFGLHLALADLLFQGGPPAAARAWTHYAAALALRPGSLRTASRLGWLLADQAAEPSVAIAELDAASRRSPDEPVVVYVHGAALFRARFLEEARQKLRNALDLAQSPAHGSPVVAALALAALGEISLDQQEFDRAERACRRSLEFADTPDARDVLGGALFLGGRRDDALAFMDESVRRCPDDALLRDHFAGSLVQVGRFQEAMAHLKEAVGLDEWLAEVQNDYAWELVNSGDPALRRPGQAVAHTQRACEMEPTNSWYRNTLGVAWYRLGDFEQCAAELESASEMPRGGGPYDLFFLAMAKQQLGLRADALQLFARATALMPADNDELVRVRAEAMALLGVKEDGS